MPKLFSRPLCKVHLRLFADDWDFFKTRFDGSDIKSTEAVRNIVSATVAHLRSKSDRAVDTALESLGSLEELADSLDLEQSRNYAFPQRK